MLSERGHRWQTIIVGGSVELIRLKPDRWLRVEKEVHYRKTVKLKLPGNESFPVNWQPTYYESC